MHYLLYILILVAVVGLILCLFAFIPHNKKPKSYSGNPKASPDKSNTMAGDTAQLATIFSSIEDGLVLVDDKGNITLFNQAAGQLTGWSVADALGISVQNVIKLSDNQGNFYTGNNYAFNKVFSSGEIFKDSNGFLVARDNKPISIGLSISPLKDTAGKVTGAVALMRNITEEKEQENRLADFISTASHEMRTPVAAIEGYLALALNNKVANVDAKARDYLEKAEEATRHLGTLFQDLLTSAKAEDGRLTNHPQVIEMGGLLKKISEDLKFAAEKHSLATSFVVGSSTVDQSALPQGEKSITPFYYAYADPDRLREVITNLYDNAVKYTAAGKITIGITGNDQVIQFYIRDTGSGIPAEDIPHLFQKFYRVDNSATRTIGGTGLGLFICRKIIELYNGRIWVESETGKGSTFYINLPRLSSSQANQLMNNAASGTLTMPTNTQPANTLAAT